MTSLPDIQLYFWKGLWCIELDRVIAFSPLKSVVKLPVSFKIDNLDKFRLVSMVHLYVKFRFKH